MSSGKKQDHTGTGFTEKIMGSPVSKAQLVMAFFVAGIADLILTPLDASPICFFIDLMVAIALFVVLGWRIILLPALIAEAIPGMGIFPFWV
ncbi:MAG: hypothetical protein IKW70_05250, partial [Verrucomicrobia bacterium]|nr:hypothetical protein [Verrucomicrobiota bacterium]